MTEKDLQIFLKSMRELHAIHTATPEKARQFLIDEGFLDANGNIAEPYRDSPVVDA